MLYQRHDLADLVQWAHLIPKIVLSALSRDVAKLRFYRRCDCVETLFATFRGGRNFIYYWRRGPCCPRRPARLETSPPSRAHVARRIPRPGLYANFAASWLGDWCASLESRSQPGSQPRHPHSDAAE